MVEANPSLARSQRQAQRQAQAVRVLCEGRAREEIKDQIRRQGKVKLSRVPARVITALARARLFEDAEYRARLIAEAKAGVEQWRAEGFFGKRAAQAAHNLRHTVRSEVPAAQPLPRNATHAHNGAAR
jgi:hypothetical protein